MQILDVQPAASTLFGFDSSLLKGTSLCDCVDTFGQWRDANGMGEMQLLMLAMLDKETEMPGETLNQGNLSTKRSRVHDGQDG